MQQQPQYLAPWVPDRGQAEPISLGPSLISGKKVTADAINLLMMDHMEAMAFFDWYEHSIDAEEKRRVAIKLCTALSIHMRVEEEIFYPASRRATGDDAMVEHAEDEHDEARRLVVQLMERTVVDAGHDAAVMQLRTIIEQHVTEEETDFFPRVRATSLDLYELGRAVAARRLDLFFERTGRNAREGIMDTASDLSVGTPMNVGSEIGVGPLDPQEAQKLFVEGLKNAHAMELNCKAMIDRQLDRLENYPKLIARMQQHRQENLAQIDRLEQILEGQGEKTSGMKDAAMSMMGNMGAMMNAPAGDEVLKNSFASAATAMAEVSAYKALIVLGEIAGQVDAIRLLQRSLSEERAMAAWLDDNLEGTVLMHLQLRSQGETAKH